MPLVGLRSRAQAADALGALRWRLAAEDVARLDAVALRRSTLAKPRWKRAIFVLAISALMRPGGPLHSHVVRFSYHVNRLVDRLRGAWHRWARRE